MFPESFLAFHSYVHSALIRFAWFVVRNPSWTNLFINFYTVAIALPLDSLLLSNVTARSGFCLRAQCHKHTRCHGRTRNSLNQGLGLRPSSKALWPYRNVNNMRFHGWLFTFLSNKARSQPLILMLVHKTIYSGSFLVSFLFISFKRFHFLFSRLNKERCFAELAIACLFISVRFSKRCE